MSANGKNAVAEFSRIDIEGFCAGKWWKTIQPWREALAEMIGAEIDYDLVTKGFIPAEGRPELARLDGLQVLEARGVEGAHALAVTEAMRRGLWIATPDEPLLVLLLLSLPGSDFPARHAAAISVRLAELTPLIEALDPNGDYGMDLLGVHAAAQRFFTAQARARRDVPVEAEYLSPEGDFVLSEVSLA